MPFLQKKPQTSTSAPLYTLGLTKNLLVVGLGNIGKDFDNTRHNVGFAGVDYFAENQDFDSWIEKKDLHSFLTTATLGSTRVIAIKPTTLMNLSGQAVQAVANFYKLTPENIIVVHDELDVDFGSIRTRVGGGSAGHKGLKSVIKYIGEDFGRVRVGIGPKQPDQIDTADFVLSKFSDKEQPHLKSMINEISAILVESIFSGSLPEDTRSFLV